MRTYGTGSRTARSSTDGRRARNRVGAFAAAVFVMAMGVLFWPGWAGTASAAPPLNNQCSVQKWQDPANFVDCVARLQDLSAQETQCVKAPTPENPDSGMAGWFATQPLSSTLNGPKNRYSNYGYAGYDYTTYDIGCIQTVMHPDYKFENTVANGEFMFATGIIGASNALREKAWQPESMWGWANPLVQNATQSIYRKVFTVFGTVTLAVIGLYLLWRSRQSDMSNAMTTAGWAIFVMVAVTAIAAWPVKSANIADQSLTTGLSVVHNAIAPESEDTPGNQCRNLDQAACVDHRPPAVRAGDTVVDSMLYRNWLRGELGSADSPTAIKYGPVLYDAKSLTWGEAQDVRDPELRDRIIARKQNDYMKVAKQIKTEDPEAYEYLQGTKGMDRIGAGFIAILSSLFFAMFDITASVLVLLGFLIFRWAVIAAPVLGTVGMLRPASAGLRRLVNAVVAAIFNIIIFGAGAAVYLFAVDLIMNTASLPGWLQVVLVWLCGVVGWLLLRPYRRITQLGGKDSAAQIALAGTWHRRFLRDVRDTARGPTSPGRDKREGVLVADRVVRPEARIEDGFDQRGTSGGASRPEDRRVPEEAAPAKAPAQRTRVRRPTSSPQWTEPAVADEAPAFTIYRPDGRPASRPATTTTTAARRPESATVRG